MSINIKCFFITGILLVSTCVKDALSTKCDCAPNTAPAVCTSDHKTYDSYCNKYYLYVCIGFRGVYILHEGPCVIKGDIDVYIKNHIGACTCSPHTSPPVCTNKGTWDSYCNNLYACLEMQDVVLEYNSACTEIKGDSTTHSHSPYETTTYRPYESTALTSTRKSPIIGQCTCTPGSSPPVCVSSHQTWDNYCDNLVECMKTKNVFLFHTGPCLIKNWPNVPLGGCTCTPGSSPAVCTSKGTWNNYCNHLNYCLELNEAFKIHDGPCLIKDIVKARKNLGVCTCRPGSSPAICTNQGTWDNYCNNLNYCLELKRAYKLYDGRCRNSYKRLKLSGKSRLSGKDIGACTCTPGSSPPVCVSNHQTWDNYCNNLVYCLKKKGLFKIHDGPCNSFDWFNDHPNWGHIHGRPKDSSVNIQS